MYEYKANYNELISDFNLYLCERFGYRNACSVMWNASASVFTEEVWIFISASGSTARVWATIPTGVSSLPAASSAMNCESTASNSSKTLYDSSKSICPATGINTSAPRMTTTSITRRSTFPASNAALWDAIATMEHR